MPIHSIYSKAVRLNGYTDGLVVPTGAFRESGVDLFNASHSEKTGGTNKVSSYESNETKIGKRHIPNEGNSINNIIGPFTIESFFIPDKGGVILHKPNCFTLKVGEPHKPGPVTFDLYTTNSGGSLAAERVVSAYNFPNVTNTNWGSYATGESKPHDLDLPSRELLYVNAQFTGKRMRVYINTDLVADMDFGGEERIIRSGSSDLFIGGQGGEFRGVIESVRVSRGIIEPKMQPFTVLPDAVGLWNFEDEDDIPDLYFFNNRNPAHPHQGKDGVGRENEGLMPLPMVCIGYDFTTIDVSSPVSPASGHPLTLAAGYDYGYFAIRDFSSSIMGGVKERPTALESLASHILSIPVEELQLQTWWASGILDIQAEVTKSTYHSDGIPVSNLNAVINVSGTDPMTGGTVSSFGYHDSSPEGGIDLDPMVNPIERMRIVAIDFNGNGSLSRPPCVVVQSSLLAANSNPNTQGFLFGHSDNTPVWFTLGNGDLVIDPGKTEARPTGQMTRARLTQNQRFSDITGNGNDAFFIATKSRFNTNTQIQTSGVSGSASSYEPPLDHLVALWFDANDKTTIKKYNGSNVASNDEYVFWWTNKATGIVASSTNYALYGWGDGWRWKQNCGNANNRAGLVAVSTSEALTPPTGPMAWPGGNPTVHATTTIPNYLSGKQYYGGSGWVNGHGVNGPLAFGRIPDVSGIVATPFASEHLTLLYPSVGANMADGDWTFYYVVTPTYTASTALTLMRSEVNDNFKLLLDDGHAVSPNPKLTATGGTAAFAGATTQRPTAGIPALISLRIDHGTNATWKWRNQQNTGGAASAVAGWTPTSPVQFDYGGLLPSSGLVLHLDANHFNNPSFDGAALSDWVDRSGNNHDFGPSAGTDRPTIRSPSRIFNNKPAIQFDGNDFLERAYDADLNTNDITVIVVTTTSVDNATYEGIVSNRNNATYKGWNLYSDMTGSNNQWEFWIGDSSAWQAIQAATGTSVVDTPVVLTATISGGNGVGGAASCELRINGASAGTATVNYHKLATSQPYCVGYTPTTYKLDGYIGEVLQYNRQLTNAERDLIEGQMAEKYGITLASGHKYLNTGANRQGGIDFFCEVVDGTGVTSDINELAPPGFIVHEIIGIPQLLTNAQDDDMQQWFEDKYGV